MDSKDHDLLIRIDEKLTILHNKFDGLNSRVDLIEKRVSSLESWKIYILGAFAAVSIGASIVYDWFKKNI